MHNFVHEYKMVPVKDSRNLTIGRRPSYLGSRCSHVTCNENRNRAVLPVVKEHNDRTHQFFGTTGNTRTVEK